MILRIQRELSAFGPSSSWHHDQQKVKKHKLFPKIGQLTLLGHRKLCVILCLCIHKKQLLKDVLYE